MTVKGTVKVVATASDSVSGVSTVRFYMDNGVLIGTKSGGPFAIRWNTKKVAAVSTRSMRWRAMQRGTRATSAPITVTVQ